MSDHQGQNGGPSATPPATTTTTAAAGDAPSAVPPPPPPAPKHPVEQCCDRIFETFKADNFCETLAKYEELQSEPLEELDRSGPMFKSVVAAWGRALMAAWRMSGDDEHMIEMLECFEERFGFASPYLLALLIDAPTIAEALQAFAANNPPPVPPEVVEALLDKYRQATPADIAELVRTMRELDIAIEGEVHEKLQKAFVFRMRAEDPEDVLREMIGLGIQPTQPHPYNFIFMKPTLKDGKDVMTYYTEMLDFGIRPHESTYRILSKRPTLGRDDAAMFRRRVKGEMGVEERTLVRLRKCQTEGNEEEATRVYKRLLLEGVAVDKNVFNTIILCCRNKPERIEFWYGEMLAQGVQPNTATFANIISVLKDTKEVDSADKWIEEMRARGVELDNHSATLIDSYVKAGQRAKATHTFRNLLEHNECSVTVYNTIMRLGPFDFAMGCLACLLGEGLQPSAHTRSTMHNLARDSISLDILGELQECEWASERILTRESLVAPPRGTYPSLMDCMRLLFREIKLDPAMVERRTSMFNEQLAAARASLSRGPVTSSGGPAMAVPSGASQHHGGGNGGGGRGGRR